MRSLPNILHWRHPILRRTTLFLCLVLLLVTLVYKQRQLTYSIQVPEDEVKYDNENEKLRNEIDINKESIFAKVRGLSGDKKDPEFTSLSRVDQCVLLLDTSINKLISKHGRSSLFQITEQLRLYDYCFLSGGLELSSVFSKLSSISPLEYNQLLFPYLSFTNDKLMWPNIYNLYEQNPTPLPPPSISNVHKFNENFWSSWINKSSSSGIVVTMSQDDIEMFQKLVNVLNYLGNNLPIHIVSTGNDFNDESIRLLSQFAHDYEQNIFLIDCSTMLDPRHAKSQITGFLNKWIATLFTTLEESILIDIDSVPFLDPKEFFSIKGYKTTGMYMYRDREILKDSSTATCLHRFLSLIPTMEEITLFDKKFKYDFPGTITNLDHHNDEKSHLPSNDFSMEHKVFWDFFHQGNMHQVDSGLVIINRRKQLISLIMAFQLHYSGEFEDCIHGDKEFFWLGPLFAGKNYSIDPTNAGTMGMLYTTDETGTGVCASQIAHTNEDDTLMWSNGGLRICKFKNSATKDFNTYEEFFKQRYNNKESLQEIYDSELLIDGIVIPNVKDIPWMQTRECSQFRFCAYLRESPTSASSGGRVIKLDEQHSKLYNRISHIWNEAGVVTP